MSDIITEDKDFMEELLRAFNMLDVSEPSNSDVCEPITEEIIDEYARRMRNEGYHHPSYWFTKPVYDKLVEVGVIRDVRID